TATASRGISASVAARMAAPAAASRVLASSSATIPWMSASDGPGGGGAGRRAVTISAPPTVRPARARTTLRILLRCLATGRAELVGSQIRPRVGAQIDVDRVGAGLHLDLLRHGGRAALAPRLQA